MRTRISLLLPALRRLLLLAVPTMIEYVLSTLFQYVDTAMVGQLGEKATAAVNVTTTINWLLGGLYSSLGIGVLALLARASGQKDDRRLKIISMQTILLALAAGVPLGAAAVLLSPYIPRWMGAEKAIQGDASVYFLIISLGLPFRALGTILASALRAVKQVRAPLYINCFANGCNIFLNYLFIYQMGLGVRGAAIASAISYVLTGLLMLWIYRRNKTLHWEGKDFRLDGKCIRECFVISLPVMGTGVVSSLGYIVFARLVAEMGTTVFAAHSIAVTAETLFYIAGYGLRTATSTLVGNALGEGDLVKLRQTSRLGVTVTVVMMCISGILLYLVSGPLMGLLSASSAVVGLGASMLRLVAFSEPFFGMKIAAEGIFYGLGKTRYPFWVEVICMWGIRIFLTALVVLVWHLDLAAVWYCMIADNVCKAVLLVLGVRHQEKKISV